MQPSNKHVIYDHNFLQILWQWFNFYLIFSWSKYSDKQPLNCHLPKLLTILPWKWELITNIQGDLKEFGQTVKGDSIHQLKQY